MKAGLASGSSTPQRAPNSYVAIRQITKVIDKLATELQATGHQASDCMQAPCLNGLSWWGYPAFLTIGTASVIIGPFGHRRSDAHSL